ncbi:MAG: Na+ dependent nucleoside transporter, partial [Flavobacteriales bacterium]|nr:Na+ dependent nucleoside transporter [Flavobacteriales bacterium]
MKKYFLFIFLFFTSFSFSQEIIGTWDFDYILPDSTESGENLKPISENDVMHINEDGSFHYEIANADYIAEGSWDLNEDLLSFHYTLPDEMVRVYLITTSGNILVLNENGVNYAFTKAEIIPEEIVTSAITINSIFRGILGIISLLLIAFLFSRNRKGIDWMLVSKGLGIQIVFALLILKVSFVSSAFEFVGKIFTKIISFTQDGTMFLFKSFETGTIESPLMNFVVMILPTVIFFSALTSLFYYWRIIPKIVYGFAWLMKSTMGLSGPESVAAAGNIFLGQTESPLLVKPYLDKMTMSEMMCLMSGGMATIAGGVLAAYIGFLGGDDPVQQIMFAKHLLAASVMSAPAAVVAAKILLPEKEAFETKLEVSKADMGSNALEAISKGTTDGLRLAVNVGAMLLVFIGLMSMANFILFKVGDWTTLNTLIENNTYYSELSFNMILGYIGAPIVWLMGVCKEDMFLVGQLLGEKTVLNEFVAYVSLGEMKNAGVFAEQKSIIIATYILCGF